ncbi:MAG: ZIP family metal transporter [Anaerolineales bacterium]|nr:ZIP family metal transporter [Anaerolineales bacterium]
MNPGPIESLFVAVAGTNPIMQGLIGGIVITFLNSIGALAVLIWRKPSERFLDTALGFAAGAMLAASFTSLILPGIERGGILPVLIGVLLGAFALDFADHHMPHLHAVKGEEGGKTARIKAVWLFIIAITIHNAPEGLAVGVGFGSGDVQNAIQLMIAIGLQNIPEGFAVAASALGLGMGTYFYASLVGVRAGLVEIPLAILGAWAVQVAQPILPYAMGFAAGAMLYVISDEIVPETHRKGHERLATMGTILGVVVMLFMDVVLG